MEYTTLSHGPSLGNPHWLLLVLHFLHQHVYCPLVGSPHLVNVRPRRIGIVIVSWLHCRHALSNWANGRKFKALLPIQVGLGGHRHPGLTVSVARLYFHCNHWLHHHGHGGSAAALLVIILSRLRLKLVSNVPGMLIFWWRVVLVLSQRRNPLSFRSVLNISVWRKFFYFLMDPPRRNGFMCVGVPNVWLSRDVVQRWEPSTLLLIHLNWLPCDWHNHHSIWLSVYRFLMGLERGLGWLSNLRQFDSIERLFQLDLHKVIKHNDIISGWTPRVSPLLQLSLQF